MSVAESVAKGLVGAVKKDSTSEEDKSNEKNSSIIKAKDFVWDQFQKYISSAILSLTVLNITVEFFRGGGVLCFHPSDTSSLLPSDAVKDPLAVYELARDRATFLNNYCVESIPVTEYYPLFLLVHGLLLIAPHFIWSAIHKGDYDSFFSIAGNIDRLRSGKTGKYSEDSFNRVKKLEKEYGGSARKIFGTYILKLLLQFLVCVGSIAVSVGWLRNFTFSFKCPQSLEEDGVSPSEWPLNVTIPCIYTTLRILSIVRVADFILTTIAALLAAYGLLWCAVRHTEQLGSQQVANFAFQSCLNPDLYTSAPVLRYIGFRCFENIKKRYRIKCCAKYLLWLISHRPKKLKLANIFFPRITNDLDFLLLVLYRADASHGKVFKDIQISSKLEQLHGRDHQLLYLYINVQQDMNELESEKNQSIDQNGVKNDKTPTSTEQGQSAPDMQSTEPDVVATDRQQSQDERRSQATVRKRTNIKAEESECAVKIEEKKIEGCAEADLGKEDETEAEERRNCCVRAWQLCCFEKKKKDDANQKEIQDAKTKLVEDFHAIFLQSGFDDDPERIAFFRFRPFLGNLEYKGLYKMRNLIYALICEHGKNIQNNISMDLCFGTIGYALVLSRVFKSVYSINFHPYYRGDQVVKEESFTTNYVTFTYPDDIYTRVSHHINQANTKIFGQLKEAKQLKKRKVDMIMVGHIIAEQHRASTTLLLNKTSHMKYISDGALLLAARPLKIGAEKVHSLKYEPPKNLFKMIADMPIQKKKKYIRYVDGQLGYKVKCGGISCIMEFAVYRYSCPTYDIDNDSASPDGVRIRASSDTHTKKVSSKNGVIPNGDTRTKQEVAIQIEKEPTEQDSSENNDNTSVRAHAPQEDSSPAHPETDHEVKTPDNASHSSV